MSNEMGGKNAKVFSSAKQGLAVTPSDTTELIFGAIYVGGGGDIVVQHDSGQVVTYVGVNGGSFFPVQGTKIMAATTASDLVAVDW